ncbi:BlyB family putative holin accessory protein, partial [Borreliella burgdorferi]
IEIIEAISADKNKKIITSLKSTRNKIMREYIKMLKRSENA